MKNRYLKKLAGGMAFVFCLSLLVCSCFAETTFSFTVTNGGSEKTGNVSTTKSNSKQYGTIKANSVNNSGVVSTYLYRVSNTGVHTGDVKLKQSNVGSKQKAYYNTTVSSGQVFGIRGIYSSGSTVTTTVVGEFTP